MPIRPQNLNASQPFRPIVMLLSSLALAITFSITPVWANLPVASEAAKAPNAVIDAPSERSVDSRLAETCTATFQKSFTDVVQQAQDYIQRNKTRKSAAILDLDETLLDNRPYFIEYKTFEPNQWHDWVLKEEAAGIPQTVAFVRWLEKNRVKVFFVSGRRENERAATIANLKKIGITKMDGLYLRPVQENNASIRNFKIQAQEEIQKKGIKPLIFLGDQESDMRSALGKGFKLPNPIYTVP